MGDGYFQKKCIDRLLEFTSGGGTLLLCSHAMYYISAFCTPGALAAERHEWRPRPVAGGGARVRGVPARQGRPQSCRRRHHARPRPDPRCPPSRRDAGAAGRDVRARARLEERRPRPRVPRRHRPQPDRRRRGLLLQHEPGRAAAVLRRRAATRCASSSRTSRSSRGASRSTPSCSTERDCTSTTARSSPTPSPWRVRATRSAWRTFHISWSGGASPAGPPCRRCRPCLRYPSQGDPTSCLILRSFRPPAG